MFEHDVCLSMCSCIRSIHMYTCECTCALGYVVFALLCSSSSSSSNTCECTCALWGVFE